MNNILRQHVIGAAQDWAQALGELNQANIDTREGEEAIIAYENACETLNRRLEEWRYSKDYSAEFLLGLFDDIIDAQRNNIEIDYAS